MRHLSVYIEKKGRQVYVGEIAGTSSEDACFSYCGEYCESRDAHSISLSLPIKERMFHPERTRNFFEGLLPEGFTRKCVAGELHVMENDYLSILSGLGRECLGAIQIIEESSSTPDAEYQKLTLEEVKNLAAEGASETAQFVTRSHLSLTGASGKAGLYYDAAKDIWYLPVGNAPSTHIVKQSHVRLKGIVMNEQLCLLTASALGIEIPVSFVINTGNHSDGEILFATERYDRSWGDKPDFLNGLPVPNRLHQEDFSQALGISNFQKYEKKNAHYLKNMFHLIRDHSANPIEDQWKLWDICVFNYLIGNTDNHIKNNSMLYASDLKSMRLAPAYDLVSTVVYESGTREMSLSIGGRYELNAIDRSCFQEEAKMLGLGAGMAMKRFDTLAGRFEQALEESSEKLKEQGFSGVDPLKDKILERAGMRFV